MFRPLLSHSFTTIDLFNTFNAKQKLHGYRKLVKKYGGDRLIHLARSIFTYGFYLIILDIVENNANFMVPLVKSARAQLYTKESVGEELKNMVARGSLVDQDLVENNFIGYSIEFLAETKNGKLTKRVYVDRRLKKKLYDRVANGKLPLKMTKIDDYIPYICKVFDEIDEKAVRSVMEHGFRKYYMLQISGNDILIANRRNYPFSVYCGNLYNTKEKMLEYWRKKYAHKVRTEYRWEFKDKPYSGYYYFGLSQRDYDNYIPEKNGRLKQKILFPRLKIFKARKEAYMNAYIDYVFRIPWKDNSEWVYILENFETRNIELIGQRDKLKIIQIKE